jgi:hypothetical protein
MKHITFPVLIVLAAVQAAWSMGPASANENTSLPAPAGGAPAALRLETSPVSAGISRASLHTGPQNDGASYFTPLPNDEDKLDEQGAPLRGDRFRWKQP